MNMRQEDKEKKEYVLFILDESGSMETIKRQTIDGINEQIQELKKTEAIDTYVSFIKFSSTPETLYWNKPLNEVELLSDENYIPNGMTAMLDAVGQGVSKLRNEISLKNDDITFLVIIVSDGAENSSKEYTWPMVQQIISECKEDKAWTITYMGANQDLSIINSSLGIDIGNILNYTADNTGTQTGFNIMSSSVGNYRMTRSSSSAKDAVRSTFYSSPTNNPT